MAGALEALLKLIAVTEEHIRFGNAGKESSCAVALAMIAAGCTFPLVNLSAIRWGLCGGRHKMTPPRSVVRFLGRVDGSCSVRPFTFQLRST